MEKKDSSMLPIIGEITYFDNNEVMQYTDSEQYLADIQKNFNVLGINGWRYKTVAKDPALILSVRNIERNEYGLEPEEEMELIAPSQDDEQRRIASNKARNASDMPECIRLLTALEEELQGEKGQVGEWMRISYELNEEYEVSPAEMVQEICDAFKNVNHQYGNHIACILYASQSIVLPNEIVHAADYLSMGGRFQDIRNLAEVGIFMGAYDLLGYDLKTDLVEFINNGGSADEVYTFFDLQELRQMNDQSEDISPTLNQY